jgi:hypothetical protein
LFVNAIETVVEFTRPIHAISRNFGSPTIIPGASTLFFVNADGWALTCRHVVDLLGVQKGIADKYAAFKADLSTKSSQKISEKEHYRRTAQKHGYTPKTMVELKTVFVGCVAGNSFTYDHSRPN